MEIPSINVTPLLIAALRMENNTWKYDSILKCVDNFGNIKPECTEDTHYILMELLQIIVFSRARNVVANEVLKMAYEPSMLPNSRKEFWEAEQILRFIDSIVGTNLIEDVRTIYENRMWEAGDLVQEQIWVIDD